MSKILSQPEIDALLPAAFLAGRGRHAGKSRLHAQWRAKESSRVADYPRGTLDPSGSGQTIKVDPRHLLGPTTGPARVETTRPRSTPASKDGQLASAAMKAATQVDDVRPEEVARAMALYERGDVGNDLENLASKMLDSLIYD